MNQSKKRYLRVKINLILRKLNIREPMNLNSVKKMTSIMMSKKETYKNSLSKMGKYLMTDFAFLS